MKQNENCENLMKKQGFVKNGELTKKWEIVKSEEGITE